MKIKIQLRKVITIIFAILIFSNLFFSCKNQKSNQNSQNEKSIKIASWNVQTFFDGNYDGIEYPEFRDKKSGWNESLYKERLERLCKIIEKIDADIIALQEIENEKIIFDISNQLSHNVWFKNKIYKYSAFGKEDGDGGSIGVAVLSRYKIQNVFFHSIDIKTEKEKAPSMRPIMEVVILPNATVKKKNKNLNKNSAEENSSSQSSQTSQELESSQKTIHFFINHWKSKSGGADVSEKWRLWQEKSLASLFLENQKINSLRAPSATRVSHAIADIPNIHDNENIFLCDSSDNALDSKKNIFIATGDFNKDINEFYRNEKNEIVLRDFSSPKNFSTNENKIKSDARDVIVYSPWDDFKTEIGTYFFRGQWSKIDHFFTLDKNLITDFSICNFEELLSPVDGSPYRYKMFTKKGYSDHLPILCTINF